jgi:hypothetical protein
MLSGGILFRVTGDSPHFRCLLMNANIHRFQIVDHIPQTPEKGVKATGKVNQLCMGINIKLTSQITIGTAEILHLVADFIQWPDHRANHHNQQQYRQN